ncbi:MAG: response regulator transcription factor [Bacteroidetes bacterium]|nr:response regulator transcription factor [Bacteroidota bacterium]
MKDSKIKVILVDDHQIVREGFKLILLLDNKFETIGEAESANSLFLLLKEKTPDVLVLDISMPGLSGIEVCKQVKTKSKEIKILMVTANVDTTHLKSAIKAGTDGFLPKDTSSEEFTKAILEVAKGNTYFSPKISGLMIKVMSLSPNNKETELSLRELEVVKQLADGKLQKEIAASLFISPRTVETHKKNIQAKLGIHTTVDLIKYAVREGITEL